MPGSSLIGNLAVNLSLETVAFWKGATFAQKQAEKLQKKLSSVGQRITDAGQKLSLGLTVPLAAFGVSSFNAASDAAELQSAFNQTFGNMSKTMSDWAEDTGNALGRSTQEMQRAAIAFGTFFNTAVPRQKAAEMSQTFAQLAQDLGSLHNVDTETAIAKLRSGLAGEAEPMRDFGVFLSEAVVQAKAMEMGLSGVGDELTEQEKILARYQLILEGTKDAQGDIARTSGGTANQVRAAKAAFEELQVTIGEKLLPVITPLISRVGDIINGFSKLPAGTQTAIVGFGALATALGPVMIGVGSLVGGIGKLAPMLATGGALRIGITALATALGGPVGLAVAAGAVVVAFTNWEKIGPWLDGVVQRSREAAGTIDSHLRKITQGADDLDRRLGLPTKQELFESFKAGLISAWNAANQYDLAKWAEGVDARLAVAATNILATIGNMVESLRSWLVDRLGSIWDSVNQKITSVAERFRWLDDVVVRHSYVPDMIRDVGSEFGKLQSLMVEPAEKANTLVADSFHSMAGSIGMALQGISYHVTSLFQDIFGEKLGGILGTIANLGLAVASRGQMGRVPGLANGGSFGVGGYSGIDRNVLSINGIPRARVSASERVHVSPAGERQGGVMEIRLRDELLDARIISGSALVVDARDKRAAYKATRPFAG